MLVGSLIASGFLLAFHAWAVYLEKRPLAYIYGVGLAFGVGPLLGVGCIFFTPVALQAGLLIILGTVWSFRRWKPRTFLLLSFVATAVAYGIMTWLALLETNALREKFPVVSMAERLPEPRRAPPLPVTTQDSLGSLEMHLESNPDSHRDGEIERRVEGFKELHEQTILRFVRSYGFGVGRMRSLTPRWDLPLRMEESLPQPGKHPPLNGSPGELEMLPPPPTDIAVEILHQMGVRDFVNPAGFGYFKDRRHVVGFQGHYFSKVPTATTWQVQTLDLVGLVVHERPVAYVSDQLPRMDELKNAPTRQLDDFEALGLAALEKGEELFVRDLPGGRRMLGAVRSARQCVGCHGGERGDLLGAFSYTLRRAEP